MFNSTFRLMHFAVFTKILYFFFYIQYCSSMPINEDETLYSQFIKDMTSNNCTLPTQIELPVTASVPTVDVFSTYLSICQKIEYLKFNKEAPLLCNEIFGLLKNISCSPKSMALPEIKIALSSEVCKDFALYKAVLPEGLMKHLSDSFDCNLMCKDEFEAPCQILLWSFLVQSHIKSIENPKLVDEVPSPPLIETKQETNPKPAVEDTSKNTNSHLKQVDHDVQDDKTDNIASQTTSKKAESTLNQRVTTKSSDSLQSITPHNQEANELKDNTPIIHLENIAKTSDAVITNEKSTKPEQISVVEDNNAKDIQMDPKENHQSDNAHVNMDEADGIPDTGIQQNENDVADPDLKAQQGQDPNPIITNKIPSNWPAAGEGSQVTLAANDAGKTDHEKGNSDNLNDPEENQHLNNDDNITQNKPVMPELKTIPGYKADYGIKIAQVDQKPSTTVIKDEAPVTTLAELPKGITEVSTRGKSPSSEAMSVAIPDISSSPTSVPIIAATAPLEKMEDEIPLPGDKDTDQYDDVDNTDGNLDGDYYKQDYDGTVHEPTKNKESNSGTPSVMSIPKEPVVHQNEDTKGYSGYSPRDSFGRGSDEIQVIASFPEQEDSHFFFYFLSIVLILMAGYLIFHNKQKIIALIVEGRHERRRRSHGLGYKKLETK